MNGRFVLALCGLSWAALTGACLAAGGGEPVWKSDLAKDPLAQGWELRGFPGQPFDGGWVEAPGKPDERCLGIRHGYWQSPAITVTPFRYYRLSFSSRTETSGYWAAVFFDAQGHELAADNYDNVYASADWEPREFCIRGHALAATVRFRFQPAEKPLLVTDVALEKVDSEMAAAWADQVAAGCPLVHYTAPENRWRLLPRTMKTLGEGGTLRVVMLGDSICNDTSNSLYETLLKRVYPKARIEVVTSVRGGTGCTYYKNEDHVEQYVFRFKPDLVIIAGISHGFDVESIRSVIQQIRAGSKCEILVMTGAICPEELICPSYVKFSGLSATKALENMEKFPSRMRRMTAEEKVEFLDMRSIWDEYVRQSWKPNEWFHRDPTHANSRGKQVVGRLLLRYFEPK
jgi:hypothetical protein